MLESEGKWGFNSMMLCFRTSEGIEQSPSGELSVTWFVLALLAVCGLMLVAFPQLPSVDCWVLGKVILLFPLSLMLPTVTELCGGQVTPANAVRLER